MCSCMHRLFITQIFNITGRATVYNCCSCPRRNSVDRLIIKNISTVKHPRTVFGSSNTQEHKALECESNCNKTKNCTQYKNLEPIMDLQGMEANRKRTQDALSPLHPSTKRKAKRANVSEVETVDFIPLSSFSAEKESNWTDFFIDHTPSEVQCYPLASTSKCHLNEKKKSHKKDTLSTSTNKLSIFSDGFIDDESRQAHVSQPDEKVKNIKKKQNIDAVSRFQTDEKLKNNKKKQNTDAVSRFQADEKLKNTKKKQNTDAGSRFQEDKFKSLLKCDGLNISDQQRRSCHGVTSHVLKATLSDDTNPNEIQILDPDVVEISPSSSKTEDIEVIEIIESENDNRDYFYENECVDVSSADYISMQKLTVADLQDTDIEIADETLSLRKKLEDIRKWSTTGLGQEVLSGNSRKNKETIFTVMSYNVLAQTLLTQNMELYRGCKPDHITWNYRWELIKHEISDVDPDILMLQEVQGTHYHTYYLPWLTYKGYEGFYKKRTGTKDDGCAIFYKTNTFSVIEHCSVEYCQPLAQNVLNRDNVGLIVKLAPLKRPHSTPVCVSTTHLLYNPRRYDIKLAQIVLLLSEIDRLCYEGESASGVKYCPVILSGDFNAYPNTALIDFLRKGRLHYEGLVSNTLARHGAYGNILGTELVPSNLGITDRCQHAILAQSRLLKQLNGPTLPLHDSRRLEETLIHLYHSQRSSDAKDLKVNAHNGPRPTGWYTHDFNLKSVYNHHLKRLGGAPEVTTKHNNGWTSVDYLFYSRVFSKKLARPVEGDLKLLARYDLLSSTEADCFSPLPSSVCPSDHFPLAAQFLLR